MSDSFTDSFGKGMQLALQMDTVRTQRAIRDQQMQELSLKLQAQAQEQAFMGNLKNNPQARQAYKSMYAPEHHPLIDYGIDMGVPHALANVPKLPVTDPIKNLTEGSNLGVVQRDAATPTGYKFTSLAQGAPKQKDYNEFQTFKLGMPQNEGELDSDYNTRVIKAWDAMLTKRAIAGRSVFSAMPTPTPGIFFDRLSKQYYEVGEGGSKRSLSSDEVKNLNLSYKEDIPTNDIRVMQQSVPSVKQLVSQAKSNMQNMNLGPAASRWRELMSGKIGSADPEFRKLRVAVSLLQTRLMKMHVGSRGGEYIMKHFQEVLDAAKDSPENLTAALNEIEQYADEVGASQVTGQPTRANKVSPVNATGKRVVRTGTDKSGRKVVQYSDGSIEHAP